VNPRSAREPGWKSVYDALRIEILSLKLAPGQPLDETTLAERFGLSRSPVREALIRLAGDELVVTLPNRSTLVAPLELASFPKYVEALDITQRVHARLAAQLRTDVDLTNIAERQRAFKAALETGDHLAMSEANKNFHMAIAHAGKNPYLIGFYERLLDQGRRMLHMHFEFLERTPGSQMLTAEHDEMLTAITAGDADRADALAHAHTRQFRDNFIRFMSENYASDLSLSGSRTAA
jgi:DNA-binding GntR family transcriptional regulator